MSLQQLAWLGTAMSGVGVMLSFIYFAVEAQHPAVRAAAFQQVINSFPGVSFDVARDRNLVELFARARRNFTALDEVEQMQFTYMMLSYLHRAESVFCQTEIAARLWPACGLPGECHFFRG